MRTREPAFISLCLKSCKYILFPSIFGKCLSVHVFLTFSYLGMARESIHMTTGLLTVVLKLCNEDIFPETAGASQILTCKQTMVRFFLSNWLQLPSVGITVELNRQKDGAHSLSLRSENKVNRLQPQQAGTEIQQASNPKAAKPGERKNRRSSNLELSARYTVDINCEATEEPEEKGQETKKQEEPA